MAVYSVLRTVYSNCPALGGKFCGSTGHAFVKFTCPGKAMDKVPSQILYTHTLHYSPNQVSRFTRLTMLLPSMLFELVSKKKVNYKLACIFCSSVSISVWEL